MDKKTLLSVSVQNFSSESPKNQKHQKTPTNFWVFFSFFFFFFMANPDIYNILCILLKDEIVYDQTLIINPHNLSNFKVSAIDQVGASFQLSVPKFANPNLYCICLSLDLRYTKAVAVQICG